MNKLQQIINRCKNGVYITVNEHRDMYKSVEEHMKDINVGPEILAEMKKRDTIVSLQAYPRSAISSYIVHHYDLNIALDELLDTLKIYD